MSGSAHPGNVILRRLTSANLERAAPLFIPTLIPSIIDGRAALEACRVLLSDRFLLMGILIDPAGTDHVERAVGVGGGVFVSRQFVQAERADPRPGLMERILRSVADQVAIAVPTNQLAAANSCEGLHLAVILHHWRSGIPDDVLVEVRHQLVASFLSDVRGFRLTEVIAEGHNDSDITWVSRGGFRFRSDYSEWYERHPVQSNRRFQIGITRDEGLANEGSVLSMIFHYTPPVFGFTPWQRSILAQAIQHRTDNEIAAALGISLSGVKKAWVSILDKAQSVVGNDHLDTAGDETRRGAQKRHKLLMYLRSHLEEIRPFITDTFA